VAFLVFQRNQTGKRRSEELKQWQMENHVLFYL